MSAAVLPAPVSLADIRAAAKRIAGAVEATPCVHSRTLSKLTGAEVFLKFENLQFTASFKERGALNKLLSLSDADRRRGVIAMSAGNHAQAVAYHAARLGIPATIVMPRGSPNTKIRNTQIHGATVVLEGDNLFEAGKHARGLAARDNLVFVHPYEDALIIAGQGTVALEMLEAVPDLEMLVVPVGGGGLISGMATAARSMNAKIEIYGVESKNYPSMHQRLNNLPVECGGDTIAEGIAVKDVGSIAFGIIRELVQEVLVVKEETSERAVGALSEIEKAVAGGAGGAARAALQEHPARVGGRRADRDADDRGRRRRRRGAGRAARAPGALRRQARRPADLRRQHRQPGARLGADARPGARRAPGAPSRHHAGHLGQPGQGRRPDRRRRRQHRRGAAPARVRHRFGQVDRDRVPHRDARPRAHRRTHRAPREQRRQGFCFLSLASFSSCSSVLPC